MRNEMIARTVVIVIAAASLYPAYKSMGSPTQYEPAQPAITDEPKARTLYKEMIEAIRSAKTLSYESILREEVDGQKWDPWTYKVWMKKPNFFCVETTDKDGANHGILVGDGQYAWSYWPNGRPWFSSEDHDAYKKTRFHVYMKEPAPGRQAPDFELLSTDRSKIKLSDYRGKVVWLTFWRVGCPPCREQIPCLEELYSKHKHQGLVVLGFDFADDRQIALDFLRQHSVTFPNIVDASEEGITTGFTKYQARAAPVNYLIDRQGKIMAAWLGHDPNNPQSADVLAKLGLR